MSNEAFFDAMSIRPKSIGSTLKVPNFFSMSEFGTTISPPCICATPIFGASGGGTKPPEGNSSG